MKLGTLWFVLVRRWFRRVELRIIRHDLSDPDVTLPQRRQSPLREGEDFYMDLATKKDIDQLAKTFPRARVQHFRRSLADPDVDFFIRMREDGLCWCFVMQAKKTYYEAEYGVTIPLIEGREIYQFDGWVHPDFRSMMIGIQMTNWGNRLRRSQGYTRYYSMVRAKDRSSVRVHQRMGFEVVGEVAHRRVLAWKFNKITWKPGLEPTPGPDSA
jgi:hypothetical protein